MTHKYQKDDIFVMNVRHVIFTFLMLIIFSPLRTFTPLVFEGSEEKEEGKKE